MGAANADVKMVVNAHAQNKSRKFVVT